MGLASSQARLLTLTARKSDLEYRAQTISQRKINLALQTEQLAKDYNAKMSNKLMKLQIGKSEQYGEIKENLSFNGITAANADYVGNFIVKTASGKVVCSDAGESFEIMKYKMVASGAYKEEEIKEMVEKGGFVVIPAVNNEDYFQDALRNGSMFLYKMSEDDGKREFKDISWSSVGTISEEYDTRDDKNAQTDYEAKTAALATQDKKLDLELNQIETQHSAIETEVDSVKKIIDKNIEGTYKIFA